MFTQSDHFYRNLTVFHLLPGEKTIHTSIIGYPKLYTSVAYSMKKKDEYNKMNHLSILLNIVFSNIMNNFMIFIPCNFLFAFFGVILVDICFLYPMFYFLNE
ncbi:hypothetical protein KUTeg_023674 [Tegillarca granosa]|uniref:Uncharacterized protein n=1 Tax=Tegillarca granosa TaxID=220873 RepID=A0ABQ9E2B9_TEGGR|nr:hypothetical protein KUTeg_023674 [Tegillarca granosa]